MAALFWPENEDSEIDGVRVLEDFSYSFLDTMPEFLTERGPSIYYLRMNHNNLTILSGPVITSFSNLYTLDISNNSLSYISSDILALTNLKAFIARHNRLEDDSLPKNFGSLENLELLNLSGNRLEQFPMQIMEMRRLKQLYLGDNQMDRVPGEIQMLQQLEVLYLGGNRLSDVPAQMGCLAKLIVLVLCDNQLQSLPPTLVQLRNLQSLSLHNNQLQTLPQGIVALGLVELSLRNNPLVVKFVRDMTWDPPSLLELAGRMAVVHRIKYTKNDLPSDLLSYLKSYRRCVNPRCRGVYFTAHVEHVKFVDFCGKYRLPLLQYLCSPKCTTPTPAYMGSSSSDSETDDDHVRRLKKVLLG